MSAIWVPDTYNRQGQIAIPASDVQLGDGTTLYYRGPLPIGLDGVVEYVAHLFSTYSTALRALASIDDDDRFGPLLHVSISRPDRNPSWGEIRLVKDAFFGDDIDAMMVLPRAAEYVNVHEFCFHLWQTPTGWRRM